jgi:hypothetical protein
MRSTVLLTTGLTSAVEEVVESVPNQCPLKPAEWREGPLDTERELGQGGQLEAALEHLGGGVPAKVGTAASVPGVDGAVQGERAQGLLGEVFDWVVPLVDEDCLRPASPVD